MKCAVFLVVISSTALVAVANPSHSIISALLLRQSGRGLYVRSGVDVSGIDKACQPSCTDVITTLNSCSIAACSCQQDNYDNLAICLNCLVAIGPPLKGDSPAKGYLTTFEDWCTSEGLRLSGNRIKATPTALTSTGDPLSIFQPETSGGPPPLLPAGATVQPTTAASQPTTAASKQTTAASQPNNQGVGSGAVGLDAFWAFATSAAIATTAATAILGASFL